MLLFFYRTVRDVLCRFLEKVSRMHVVTVTDLVSAFTGLVSGVFLLIIFGCNVVKCLMSVTIKPKFTVMFSVIYIEGSVGTARGGLGGRGRLRDRVVTCSVPATVDRLK